MELEQELQYSRIEATISEVIMKEYTKDRRFSSKSSKCSWHQEVLNDKRWQWLTEERFELLYMEAITMHREKENCRLLEDNKVNEMEMKKVRDK